MACKTSSFVIANIVLPVNSAQPNTVGVPINFARPTTAHFEAPVVGAQQQMTARQRYLPCGMNHNYSTVEIQFTADLLEELSY